MNLSTAFADHDETLLYMFYTMTNNEIQYHSAQELGRRGWLYNDLDQTWSVTRKGGSNKINKNKKQANPNSRANGKGDESEELCRYKFDTEQWRIVEFSVSEYKQQENQPQKRFDDIESLRIE